jgi:uncharacterized protein (TIGR03437 family)
MKCTTISICVLARAILTSGAWGQTAPHGRTIRAVDDSQLIRVAGSVHPFARPEADAGRAPANLPMNRILLALSRPPERQRALEALLQAQQNPSSPIHHRWLTPEQFGEQFGPSIEDVATVVDWLSSKGLTGGQVAKGRGTIEFTSTAGAVEQAFHTEIHKYVVSGREYWANSSDISIPAALSAVVQGVVSLNNFAAARAQVQPELTDTVGNHYIAPGDFNTIYNVTPILGTYTGKGATIAVIGTASFDPNDVDDFRYRFNLPAYTPQQFQMVYNGPNTGSDLGDPVESLFDTTWAGAIASNANVIFVDSPQTTATPGAILSEQYIVDNNVADIITESYSMCETDAKANGLFASLMSIREQAAAQGMTWVVAAGDSGAYSCDNFHALLYLSSPPQASVSAFASSPYTVAVGGTEFTGDLGNSGQYWTTENTAASSARGYIPEGAWNESCAYGAACFTSIVAGGGGSSVGAKPSWQAGVLGILNDGTRDLPDLAFSSAGHDPYAFCMNRGCAPNGTGMFQWQRFRGTSAAAPSFASILALVKEKVGERIGNVNPTLYALARSQDYSMCTSGAPPAAGCIFNDIVSGNTAIPGGASAMYAAGAGYDMATGLGSVNVANLVKAWPSPPLTATQTTLSATPVTAAVGTSISVSVQVVASSGPGTPTGPVSVVSSQGLSFPVGPLVNGAAQSAIPNLPAGAYSLTAKYGGDVNFAASSSTPIPINISASQTAPAISLAIYAIDSNGQLSSATEVGYGTDLLLAATVGNGTQRLQGTVTFSDNGTVLPNSYSPGSNGMAGLTTALLAPGTHSIVAKYSNDQGYPDRTSTPASIVIRPAIAAVTLRSACAASGDTLSANLSAPGGGAAPTGTLAFISGNKTLASVPASTTTPSTYQIPASLTLPAVIQAAYSGDANYASAMATVNVGLTVCAAAIVDSAASAFAPATEGLATIYGAGLAVAPVTASSAAWPTTLGGVGVVLKDSGGNSVQGRMSYVSPGQLNFEIPPGLNPGPITAVVNGVGNSNTVSGNLDTVSPALFVSYDGKSVPLAQIVSVTNGVSSAPVPIGPVTFTSGTELILVLYATGIRNHPASSDVRVAFNGTEVEPVYAGPQPTYPGLDQINVPIPASLAGAGSVTVKIVVVDATNGTVAWSSNTGTLTFPSQ